MKIREQGQMGESEPLRRMALRDGVYERLLAMLLDGSLGVDDALSIDGLARRLGVSPTPIREALVDLEHTGLIARRALKGYTVTPPMSASQVDDWVDARRVIELGAMDVAMREPEALVVDLSEAQRAHEAASEAMEHAAKGQELASYRAYFDADWGFHLTFIRRAENDYLLRMAQTLGFQIHRLRESYPHGELHVCEAIGEHTRILEAVATGDPARARAALEEHLEKVRERSRADVARRSEQTSRA